MAEKLRSIISRIIYWLHWLEDAFLVILLGSMILLAVTQIGLRNFFDSGVSWADPLLRLSVLWVGLAGAMLATRQDHHITIDVLTRLMSDRLRLTVRVFSDLFTASVCALIAWHALRLVAMDKEAETMAFAQIPTWWCELIIPLAFSVIALRYILFAGRHLLSLCFGSGKS